MTPADEAAREAATPREIDAREAAFHRTMAAHRRSQRHAFLYGWDHATAQVEPFIYGSRPYRWAYLAGRRAARAYARHRVTTEGGEGE